MKPINLFKSYADEEEIKAVNEIIRRGTYWAKGQEIKEFEDKIAEFHKRKFAIAFNSGTSALTAILKAYDISEKNVIVPSFTFPATVNAVIEAGGWPVFADIEDETFGLDIKDVRLKINKFTTAILPIHFAGAVSRDIGKLKNFCDSYKILLIEDNAHSIGAKLNGKMTGTFGDASMLSFCFNKILTTGEGGMALTDDNEIAKKIRLMNDHGQINKEYLQSGSNLRMPTMAAALGLAQFKKLDFLIQKRNSIAEFYDNALKKTGLELPIKQKGRVYQLYNVLLKTKKQRDGLQEYLKSKNIPTRITYKPVHTYDFYKTAFRPNGLSVTEDISGRILTLPLHPCLNEEQLNYIVDAIKGSPTL